MPCANCTGTSSSATLTSGFTLLTGVSKFSKVSLFSDLNNLVDITLDPRYSTICGYTDPDLDEVFCRGSCRDSTVRPSATGTTLDGATHTVPRRRSSALVASAEGRLIDR